MPRIAFLDDDPVLRIARLVLQDPARDRWIRDFFAPEDVDLAPLVAVARGIGAADGVAITLADASTVRDADVVVFRRARVGAAELDANPRLRLIQRFGERPDGIDVGEARRRNVPVSCLPRRTLRFTAEHTILLMLALGKRLLEADRIVRSGAFDPSAVRPLDDVAYNWPRMTRIHGLDGRTLGILGLGEVGTLVARLAGAFGMRVIYYKRTRASADDERSLGVDYAPLPELLREAHFVSVHAANIPGNEALVGRALLAQMRADAFLVNTSRGRLVDEDALYEALVGGRIAGAGLDVHRVEPRAPDRFAALPNVVMTPHLAGGPRGGVLEELALLIGNCRAALRGGRLQHVLA